MALYRLHKKEWEASKQGFSTKTSQFFLQVKRFSLIRTPCTGARKEPTTSSDHATPKRTSSGITTVVTKVMNGKAVSKEVGIASGKTIVKAVKQNVNVKTASGGTMVKDVRRESGTKGSWWQNFD